MQLSALAEGLLAPLTDPSSRTWWGGLALSALIAALWYVFRRPGWTRADLVAALRHPSTGLDAQLYLGRQALQLLIGAPSAAGAYWLATRSVMALDARLGVPSPPPLDPTALALAYSLVLFVIWDASRWLLHWLMHRVPALWALHQVHHSAEVLTPLTFHRLHPLESMLYQLRGALVTGGLAGLAFWLYRGAAEELTILGVSGLGLAFNALTGNLRHSHLWLPFPAPVERWLISPAQHQLHHSADPAHFDSNYGTWLAIWDRLAGTLRPSPVEAPARYGVPDHERNHGDDLLSAWLGPIAAILRGVGPRASGAAAAALVGLAGLPEAARAQETLEAPSPDAPPADAPPAGEPELRGGFGESMIVYAPDGTPRVAGSAHAIGEEELAQFEYDNIEEVLSQVPGVTTRSEDGFGLRPNIGIRGANSDRSAKLTLMEDGVLFAPAPYAAPAAYYFPMSTRLVGVEVFKGPAATRHGPHTVGGAINLLTRDVPDEGRAAYADASIGLYGTWKAHAWGGVSGDGGGALAEVVHLRSAGFKELDGGGDTGFDRTEVMLKGRLTPGAHALELKLGYANETSNETYLGLTLADLEADPYRRYVASAMGLMTWDRTQAELSWDAPLGERAELHAVAYHHWLDRSWTKLNEFSDGPDLHDLLQQAPTAGQSAVYLAILRGEEDTSSPDQALMIGTNDREFHNVGLQSAVRWERYGERLDHVVEGGARLHGDLVERVHTQDAYDMISGELVLRGEPTETTLDSRSTAAAAAAWLHDDVTAGDLHVLPGARVEVVRGYREDVGVDPLDPQLRAIVLPGVGALWSATDWLDLFAGAHRGFSPVAPGQAPEVQPETSWNYETGLRWVQGERHVEAVGFVNDYQNLTGQCTLSGGCDDSQVDAQYNGGEVWVYGAEAVAGNALLLPGELSLPFDFTYAWTRSRFRTGFTSSFPQFGAVEIGDSLPYVPEHQYGATLGLRHPRFSLSVGASGRTGMLDEAGAFPIDALDVPPIFLVDAAANAQLNEKIQLYATGTNLNGSTALTSWRPFGARPTAPRQVMGGLKVEL